MKTAKANTIYKQIIRLIGHIVHRSHLGPSKCFVVSSHIISPIKTLSLFAIRDKKIIFYLSWNTVLYGDTTVQMIYMRLLRTRNARNLGKISRNCNVKILQ